MSDDSGSGYGAAVGGIFGGIGKIQEANAQIDMAQAKENQLDSEATTAYKNAQLALQYGQYNAERQQIVSELQLGTTKANYGASGVKSTSGSVLDIIRQSHTNSELDRLEILHQADMSSENFMNQGKSLDAGSNQARKAANRGINNLFFTSVGALTSVGSLMGSG